MQSITYHPESQIDANGITITYDSFGDQNDPVILLIMGLATQLIHWDEDFCKKLASQGYWVIRFDNRDIGKSTKFSTANTPNIVSLLANQWFGRTLKAPYLLDDMAEDALDLLAVLKIDKAHVVGVSMGGMIAQCMAIKAPNRIHSMTSIMSTTGARNLPKAKSSVSLKVMKPLPKEEDKFVAQGLKMWQLLHGEHFEFDNERISKLIVRAKNRSFNPAGVLRQLSAIIASGDRTSKLANVSVPSLIMHGDADPLVPFECGVATAAVIQNSRFKSFKGMGHTLPSQLWDEMINEITDLAKAAE